MFIDVKSSATANVEIIAYDMLGRTIETKTINIADGSVIELGNDYPEDVYIIVVKQEDNSKDI